MDINISTKFNVGDKVVNRGGHDCTVGGIEIRDSGAAFYLLTHSDGHTYHQAVSYVDEHYVALAMGRYEAIKSLSREQLERIVGDLAATAFGEDTVRLHHSYYMSLSDEWSTPHTPSWLSLRPLERLMGR